MTREKIGPRVIVYEPVDIYAANRVPSLLTARADEILLKPKNLEEALDISLRAPKAWEDTNIALQQAADEALMQIKADNPTLAQKRSKTAKVRFIKEAFGFDYGRVADLLGITPNQVARKDYRPRRKKELGKFERRLTSAVVVAGILKDQFPSDIIGSVIERRASISLKNGKLSDEFSILTAMNSGFGNVAVAIALETVRLNHIVHGNQPLAQKYTP